VQRVHALFHRPEGVKKVVIDLEIPSLDLAPQVPPRLQGVLREEAGELLEGVHRVLVPLESGVQHLEEKDSRNGIKKVVIMRKDDFLEFPGEGRVCLGLSRSLGHLLGRHVGLCKGSN
jgi:hypothetical protein